MYTQLTQILDKTKLVEFPVDSYLCTYNTTYVSINIITHTHTHIYIYINMSYLSYLKNIYVRVYIATSVFVSADVEIYTALCVLCIFNNIK